MINCDDCRWFWNNDCRKMRLNEGCYSCPQFDNDSLECKCSSLTSRNPDNYNNECPYFEEYEGNNEDTEKL